MGYPAGTLDLEAVKLGIYQWVQGVTQGIIPPNQIIWRNQSEPLPPRPCVTMKIISGPSPTDRNGALFFNRVPNPDFPLHSPKPFIPDAANPFTVGMQMEMSVSIQVFGNTKLQKGVPLALQLTLDLNTSLIRQSILDKLKAAGVSIQGKGQVQNLTALEETQYEERGGFDIAMGLVQNVIDDPGTIETVNLELNTPSGDREVEIELP